MWLPTRTVLSRHGFRRMYQTAVKRADLDHLQLRGPHDFRHIFSTCLEEAGIPARVIDELMGHQRTATAISTVKAGLGPATGTPLTSWRSVWSARARRGWRSSCQWPRNG
jgi:hypothetical protein